MAKRLSEELEKVWQELEKQQKAEVKRALARAGLRKQESVQSIQYIDD